MMDNVWERLAQLQVRQLGEIVYRRSFHKSNTGSQDDGSDDPSDIIQQNLGTIFLAETRPGRFCDADEKQGLQPFMDKDLWKNLPENLIDSILLLLPLHSFLRFRSVCRRWNSLLHCPNFHASRQVGHAMQSEKPWMIFRGSARECVAYNPTLGRWVNVPLAFLPSPRVRVVASAGGLLCVRRRDDSLLVCNPFTKAYVHVKPKHCKWKYPIVAMVADRNSERSYKIIVAGSNGAVAPDLITEVYDSSTKTWKLFGSRLLKHHFQTNAVFLDGFLYSAGFSFVIVYDIKREVWSAMKGPPVTQHTNLIMPQICECRGQLLMVEVVSERFIMRRISIWANYDGIGGDQKWVKLDTMPEQLLDEIICMSSSRFFTYFGHDDLLCFVIARREILVYTVSKRDWRWLPTCPFVQGFAKRFAAFPFHPSLNAIPL